MAVIYKATNIVNGKSYIGFAVDLEKRKKEHKRKSEFMNKQYFHNSIAKYGFENFVWEILKEDASLDDEKYFIEEHKTFWKTGKGYNLTKGGEGKLGYVVSEKTRSKMSASHKNRQLTENQLRVLRENAKIMKEKGHTEETKRKISNSHKGKKKTESHRKNISLNHASKKETGAYYQSEEYKEKMRKSLTGRKRTEEQKQNYKEAALRRWAKNKSKEI
jgi:group I intron endonuclease